LNRGELPQEKKKSRKEKKNKMNQKRAEKRKGGLWPQLADVKRKGDTYDNAGEMPFAIGYEQDRTKVAYEESKRGKITRGPANIHRGQKRTEKKTKGGGVFESKKTYTQWNR